MRNASMKKLCKGEPHPIVWDIVKFFDELPDSVYKLVRERFSVEAEKGNRVYSLLMVTLGKVLEREALSDRDLMSLAWAIKRFLETGKLIDYPKGKWYSEDPLKDILEEL